MKYLSLLLVACALEGDPVQDRPEWAESVEHVDAFGLLGQGCADLDATYNLVSDDTWRRHAFNPYAGGLTENYSDVVWVRETGQGPFTPSFILRHEFTHVLLRCAGVPEAVHKAHTGPVWDGLRGTDPGDR